MNDVTSAATLDIDRIRADFPILTQTVRGKPLVFLDSAASAQKPRAVIDRLSEFYERENSNIHRAAHALAARSTDAYEAAREKVRRFLGAASTEEIVFVRGTTYNTVLLETGGLVLGVDEHATYPTETQTLHPGDTLCLYTDGITETRSPDGEEFGYDSLEGRVQAAVGLHLSAEEIAANIYDAVLTHMRGNPPHDDMTLLAIRFVPEEAGVV